jgi:hypothetical protein
MADAGKSDCWFDFTELPEGFDGEPQRFDFIVHLSEAKKDLPASGLSPVEPAMLEF